MASLVGASVLFEVQGRQRRSGIERVCISVLLVRVLVAGGVQRTPRVLRSSFISPAFFYFLLYNSSLYLVLGI